MIELTETDLLAIISRDELDGLAKEVLELGQPDPIASAIPEALGTIKMYADPFLIQDDPLRRIWRILAVCWLYNRLAVMPEKREKEQAWAIGVLEGIRDGKFPNLLVDEEVTDQGAWGSEPKFNV